MRRWIGLRNAAGSSENPDSHSVALAAVGLEHRTRSLTHSAAPCEHSVAPFNRTTGKQAKKSHKPLVWCGTVLTFRFIGALNLVWWGTRFAAPPARLIGSHSLSLDDAGACAEVCEICVPGMRGLLSKALSSRRPLVERYAAAGGRLQRGDESRLRLGGPYSNTWASWGRTVLLEAPKSAGTLIRRVAQQTASNIACFELFEPNRTVMPGLADPRHMQDERIALREARRFDHAIVRWV